MCCTHVASAREFPVDDGRKCFDDLGKNCIMDCSARGTLSPSDATAVGPDGTLSSSDLAGMLFPPVPAGIPFTAGPVGLCGMLSPSNYVSVVLVDPGGTLPSSDLVEMLFPAVPAGYHSQWDRLAPLASMGRGPRLTPVLRYWWTLVGCSPHLTWPE